MEKSNGKNGWKEIICLNENGEQNAAIRIMTYRSVFQKNHVGPYLYPYLLAPGSDWDLRLLREHRETFELDSGFPAG